MQNYSRKFNINSDYYDMKEELFKETTLSFKSGLTVLVGCNGYGKTTVLNFLDYENSESETPCLYFNNVTDGGLNAVQRAWFYDDMDFVIKQSLSSEGENIVHNIEEKAKEIGSFVRKNSQSKEIWFLFDAIDSGLSIDNIIALKDFFKVIIKDCYSKNITPYFLCTANSYEMCRDEECFDVHNGTYIKFKDYEEYRNFILDSKEIKKNRYIEV